MAAGYLWQIMCIECRDRMASDEPLIERLRLCSTHLLKAVPGNTPPEHLDTVKRLQERLTQREELDEIERWELGKDILDFAMEMHTEHKREHR